MKLELIKSIIKRLTILEKMICLFSLIIGFRLTYDSIYFIYAYHFTSILFLCMAEMTLLVSKLILGLLLLHSGFSLILYRKNTAFFYKLTGIIIMLYPLNLNILDFFRNDWTIKSLYIMILFPFGLILYIIFKQKKYEPLEQKFTILRLDKIKLAIGFSVFLMIDIFFFKWDYFDRIL